MVQNITGGLIQPDNIKQAYLLKKNKKKFLKKPTGFISVFLCESSIGVTNRESDRHFECLYWNEKHHN